MPPAERPPALHNGRVAVPDAVPHDDPYLQRIREIALTFPGAQEKRSVGHPSFFTKKVFVWVGMAAKVDDEWVRYPHSIAFFLPEHERAAILEHPKGYLPGYIGPWGWVGMHLDEDTDWDEVRELIEESYRTTAGKKLIAELDSRTA